jgi:D-tyrosyl-tRNA(Tyr) deacylase
MRSVVQRVRRARVVVGEEEVAAIGAGLLALVALIEGDGTEDVDWLSHKLRTVRIFEDAEGKMNRSLIDVGGELLLVSQFTLSADIGKGARPSFMTAMHPDRARPMFDSFVAGFTDLKAKTGRFGAHMEIELHNDGPVTLWLDSKARARG